MEARDQEPLAYITAFLTKDFRIPPQRLAPEATFSSLNLDSIAQVELFVTLSDRYGVELDDSLASGELTLGEMAGLVRAQLGGPDGNTDHAQAPA
ncbi:acyl carrier protein [Streptomyces sp. NBC_01426]|uniref:acyl carrier protein n=1 Tax=Streptomyces sp. NBC_01426 TaxID=2975866 RepID=UPI002E3401A3|nr:acyl carrier protein [Streptomyces sp. NBC_01426]